jgi:hypothetical protein
MVSGRSATPQAQFDNVSDEPVGVSLSLDEDYDGLVRDSSQLQDFNVLLKQDLARALRYVFLVSNIVSMCTRSPSCACLQVIFGSSSSIHTCIQRSVRGSSHESQSTSAINVLVYAAERALLACMRKHMTTQGLCVRALHTRITIPGPKLTS